MGFALVVNLRKFTANHYDLYPKIEKGAYSNTPFSLFEASYVPASFFKGFE